MAACSSTLETADLDRLRPGIVLLTVPLLDDIVQVGIGGDYPTTTVVVSVTRYSMRVRRADGRRLQAHIVENWQDATAAGVATRVFAEPVNALELERCAGQWGTGGGLTSVRAGDLDRFVATIARFALAKQQREGHTVGAA
ncbi:hypothetical protein [Mycolicibacterium frederiksbergense]|nr:hypothetical protein [Mycolicibacterium frederiksbergense]